MHTLDSYACTEQRGPQPPIISASPPCTTYNMQIFSPQPARELRVIQGLLTLATLFLHHVSVHVPGRKPSACVHVLPYACLDPRVRVRCFVQLISVRCVYTKCRRNPRVVEKEKRKEERKKIRDGNATPPRARGIARQTTGTDCFEREKEKKRRKEKRQAAHKSWRDRVTAISFSGTQRRSENDSRSNPTRNVGKKRCWLRIM